MRYADDRIMVIHSPHGLGLDSGSSVFLDFSLFDWMEMSDFLMCLVKTLI